MKHPRVFEVLRAESGVYGVAIDAGMYIQSHYAAGVEWP